MRPNRWLGAALSLLCTACAAGAAPWEQTLRGKMPQAQERIRFLCTERAGERIFGRANGVQAVSVLQADPQAPVTASFHSEVDGVSRTYLPHMFVRMGLKEVEFDAAWASGPKPAGLPVAVDDPRLGSARFSDAYRANVEIVFSSAATAQDAALGIFGRKIQVRLAPAGRVLGERTEFYWFHGSDPRTRVRRLHALCPGFTLSHQTMPSDFLSRVINPDAYPCMSTYVREKTLAKDVSTRSVPGINGSSSDLRLWGEQVRQRAAALLQALNACEAEYFARPSPVPFSLAWDPQPGKQALSTPAPGAHPHGKPVRPREP